MAQQTSINVQPVNGSSEQNNRRAKHLGCVRKDLSHLNDYWESDTQANRLATIQANYFEKFGSKLQSRANPIRECEIIILESTTLPDLLRLADAYRERFGIEVFQIAIHRDEGHWVNSEGKSTGTKPNEQPKPGEVWKPNLHAHMVFDWTNHATGKFIKPLSCHQMKEMLSLISDYLNNKPCSEGASIETDTMLSDGKCNQESVAVCDEDSVYDTYKLETEKIANYVNFITDSSTRSEELVKLSDDWNHWTMNNSILFDKEGLFTEALRAAARVLISKIHTGDAIGLTEAINYVTNIGFENSMSSSAWEKANTGSIVKGIYLAAALNLSDNQKQEAIDTLMVYKSDFLTPKSLLHLIDQIKEFNANVDYINPVENIASEEPDSLLDKEELLKKQDISVLIEESLTKHQAKLCQNDEDLLRNAIKESRATRKLAVLSIWYIIVIVSLASTIAMIYLSYQG